MKFLILLSLFGVSRANILQYAGIKYDSINLPSYPYPSYEKPSVYHHNDYVVKPQTSLQYPNVNGPVCATYNGVWRTFANIYQYTNEVNNGHAWNLYSSGNCPQLEKPLPEPLEPICATYNNKLRTFSNAVAMEVENLINGKNWIKLFVGVCPYIPPPATTTAAPLTTPSAPCSNQPVCGFLNGVWKTFANITEFNIEVDKGLGWAFYSYGLCPKPEVCAKFKNELRTFSSVLAVEVDKIVSGKNWVIISSGVCIVKVPPAIAPESTTSTTTTTTTTPLPPVTDILPAEIADSAFRIFISDTTESINKATTPPPADPSTTSAMGDDSATITTPSGSQINQRIQQHNSYNGPYVEGSYHYNHNTFNQANIKPCSRKRY